MTYLLSIATQEGRDLVVDALRSAARQRSTVARKAAGKVAESKRTGRDVRSQAVRVTGLLAEANTLEELADELARATDLAIVTRASLVGEALDRDAAEPGIPDPDDPEAVVTASDDGTSLAAQAAAARAGLTPYDPDAPEDPLTGATPEDEPNHVEEVLP